MKKFTAIVFSVFCLFACSSAASAACPAGSYSILKYGAVPNDSAADGEAFQNAVNRLPAKAVLCFPKGVYLIDRQVNVKRDDLTIRGEGISSVLRMMKGVNVTMLKIGDGNSSPQVTAKRITLEKIAFDGNLNSGLTGDRQNFFGIWVVRGENITFRDMFIEKFFHDAITVANGEVPNVNILFERVRSERSKRNAIHIGFGQDIIFRNCILDTNQDEATWGVTSGNAIDVEIEGYYPPTKEGGWVKRLTIEDTFFRHTNLGAAGGAIALQTGSGPIADVTVQRNIALEKGFASTGADFKSGAGNLLHNTNIKFYSNWISTIAPGAAFSGFVLKWTDNSELNDNVVTNYANGNFHMVWLAGVNNISGNNNSSYRFFQADNPWNDVFYVEAPYTQNQRVKFLNTMDNGWTDSRIVHYDASNAKIQSASIIGASLSTVTWINNPKPIPTNSPSIKSAQISSGNLVVRTTEPNSLPVRVVALRNSLPIGMKASIAGTATLVLPERAVKGDVFEVRAYNQHGREATYKFTF